MRKYPACFAFTLLLMGSSALVAAQQTQNSSPAQGQQAQHPSATHAQTQHSSTAHGQQTQHPSTTHAQAQHSSAAHGQQALHSSAAAARQTHPCPAVKDQPPVPPPAPIVQPMEPYTSTDGRFFVQFPGAEVKHDTQSIPLQGTDTSTLYEFWTESTDGNVSYMVMYNDYPSTYANDGSDAVLTRTRDGAVKGKTMVFDMSINLNGVPGHEFTSKDDNWNFTVRQFFSGKRLYQLIVVSKPGDPATQTSEFLDSFKIQ